MIEPLTVRPLLCSNEWHGPWQSQTHDVLIDPFRTKGRCANSPHTSLNRSQSPPSSRSELHICRLSRPRACKRAHSHVRTHANEMQTNCASSGFLSSGLTCCLTHRDAPPLPRVDLNGISLGSRIPMSTNPGVSRQIGPFRSVNLLPDNWKSIQDSAIRRSVILSNDAAPKISKVRGEGNERLGISRVSCCLCCLCWRPCQ